MALCPGGSNLRRLPDLPQKESCGSFPNRGFVGFSCMFAAGCMDDQRTADSAPPRASHGRTGLQLVAYVCKQYMVIDPSVTRLIIEISVPLGNFPKPDMVLMVALPYNISTFSM
jgi:hypothetical protein